VDFSPDGQRIASGSWDDTIKLWDAESGDLLKTLKHSSTVKTLVFSPDGNYIASDDGFSMRIWAVEEEKALLMNSISPDNKGPLTFSPTGDYVVRGDGFGQVHILDTKSGKCVKEFRTHKGFWGIVDINAVSFSPDGKYLLVAADNEYINVYLFE
jgi:WD40 repeat protein